MTVHFKLWHWNEASKSDSKILEQIPELKLCYLSYNFNAIIFSENGICGVQRNYCHFK